MQKCPQDSLLADILMISSAPSLTSYNLVLWMFTIYITQHNIIGNFSQTLTKWQTVIV